MTDKKKVVKKYLRAKSLKITAGTDFVKTVIEAAAYLTIHSNDVGSLHGQPSVLTMRAPLLPAYTLIAEQLGPILGIETTPDRLSALSVDLRPVLGTFTLCFSYRTDTGQFQPYNMHVSAADNLNTFLRIKNQKGVEFAQDFIEQI